MANKALVSFFERLFFKPNLLDWVLIFFLFPLSLLYGLIMLIRRSLTPKKDYSIPIISIGNLTVGGSGKTPFLIALASHYKQSYIISRGYGRQSRGLVEVSHQGRILTDVFQSGDEAMLMAKSLPYASVMVSEERERAIELALQKGAKVIFLDDGFNRVNIKKFEILLFPQTIKNYMTFPAGPFREFFFTKAFSNMQLYENQEFKRVVKVINATPRMLLVTAISNPERLNPFLPKGVIDKFYLEDHSYFDEHDLRKKMKIADVTSLLITQKDAVKMEDFKLPLSVMQLELQIKNEILEKINHYVGEYAHEK